MILNMSSKTRRAHNRSQKSIFKAVTFSFPPLSNKMSEIPLVSMEAKYTASTSMVSDELFLAVHKMKSFKHALNFATVFGRRLEFLELALEASKLVTNKQEEILLDEAMSQYNPIWWDLIKEHTHAANWCSYREFMREATLTFDNNWQQIDKEYQQIIKPHRWGKELKPEHRKYTEFVKANIERDSYFLTIFGSSLAAIIAIFIIVLVLFGDP